MSALKLMVIAVSFTLLSFTISVHCLSSGAPTKACTSLTPGHWWNHTTPIEPRQDEPPYSIMVDQSSVGPGGTVNVTIYGELFQGLFLQARVKDTKTPMTIGKFTIIPYLLQPRDCNETSDSVTHKDPRDKTNGTTLTWTAPSEQFGDFYFMATVAKDHDAFWVGLQSAVVEYTDGEPTPEPTPPSTTAGASCSIPHQVIATALLVTAVAVIGQ